MAKYQTTCTDCGAPAEGYVDTENGPSARDMDPVYCDTCTDNFNEQANACTECGEPAMCWMDPESGPLCESCWNAAAVIATSKYQEEVARGR